LKHGQTQIKFKCTEICLMIKFYSLPEIETRLLKRPVLSPIFISTTLATESWIKTRFG